MPYLYPPAVVQILIANGVPAVGGYVEAYFANTSVRASLFDTAGTELPWPVVADSNGQVSYCLNVGTTYDLRAYDADGGLLWEAPDVNASPAGTITTSYEVLTSASDPMPAYLGLKLTAGNNITITPVLGGHNGTVLEIASTGGGGSAEWEVVTKGGVDYFTPVAGAPQSLAAGGSIVAGDYSGLSAQERHIRLDGANINLQMNDSQSGSTNTAIFIAPNDSTQIVRIVATRDVGTPTRIELSAQLDTAKASTGWLALDADNCLTLATPSPSDVGAQPASTNLGSIASLADAVGWLKNSGTGVFSYTTPTAADVGAQPASTILGTFSALANATGWLKNNGAGVLSYSTPTASDVGAIPVGGAVLSVTASGSSITVGGTATNPTVAINLGNSNAWTAKQTISVPAGGNFALELDGYASLVNGYWNVTSTPGGVAVIAQTAYAGSSDVLAYYNTSTDASAAVGFRGLLNYGAGSITAWNVVTSKSSSAAVTNFKQLNAAGTLVDVATWTGATGLTLPQTAVTWSGNPTHSGNHTFSGNLTVNGNTTIGNATSNTFTMTARVASNIDPSTTNTRSLGQDTLRWAGVYATEFYRAGVALGTTLAGYLPLTGGTITGNLTVGDASSDTLTINALVGSNINPSGSRNLGTSTNQWSAIFANAFSTTRAVAGNTIVESTVTGDAAYRFSVFADGKHNWGDGTNTFDTNLYRSAANVLATDDTFKSSGVRKTVASKTADYTLTATDEVVVLTGTTGRTLTLPDATGSGQTYTLCNECTGGALLTIGLNTGDTINATTGWTVPQNQSITVCDYADEKWVIL